MGGLGSCMYIYSLYNERDDTAASLILCFFSSFYIVAVMVMLNITIDGRAMKSHANSAVYCVKVRPSRCSATI